MDQLPLENTQIEWHVCIYICICDTYIHIHTYTHVLIYIWLQLLYMHPLLKIHSHFPYSNTVFHDTSKTFSAKFFNLLGRILLLYILYDSSWIKESGCFYALKDMVITLYYRTLKIQLYSIHSKSLVSYTGNA